MAVPRELVPLIPPQGPLGLPITIPLLGVSMGLLGSPFDGDLLGHIPNRHRPQLELGLAVGWTGSICIVVWEGLFFLHNRVVLPFVLAVLWGGNCHQCQQAE